MPLRASLVLAAMSLLSFLGCQPRSTEWPASLADVRVEAAIEHRTERGHDTRDYTYSSIKVVLYRVKGGALECAAAKIEVNGVPLEFRVAQGNYYDRHPYYRLADGAPLSVTPATDYRFVLITPDGKRQDIGVVRTAAPLDVAQFSFPKLRPADGRVTIGWKDLAEPVALTMYRSDFRREDDQTQVHVAGSSRDPAALRREIGGGLIRRRSDQWEIPAKFLADQEGLKLETLNADAQVVHTGSIAKAFAKGSTLVAERTLTLRMEFMAAQ